MLQRFSFILLYILLLAGCRSVEPNRPEESYTYQKPEFSKRTSVINIPVHIEVSDIQKRINNNVNNLIYKDNSYHNNNNDGYKIKVWKDGSIDLGIQGNLAKITIPLKIWAKAGWEVSKFGFTVSDYRETDFALDLHYITRFQMGKNWQVKARTSGNGFDWKKEPVVSVGPVDIPIKSLVDDIIDDQQAYVAGVIDKQLKEQMDFKSYVQTAWETVQEPVQLSEAYNTWFKITPKKILMTPLQGENGTLKTSIGFKALTETIIGEKPYYAVQKQLPPLQFKNKIPGQFSFALSTEISYVKATELMADYFVNETYQFKDGKYEITITSTEIYGHGQDLVVSVGMTGDLDGTIYLKGKPAFDTTEEAFYFRELEYDLDTKQKLVKAASWLAHGHLLKTLQKRLRIPVHEEFQAARESARAYLDNYAMTNYLYLNGKLQSMQPAGIYVTPQKLVAVLEARGKASVTVKDF